MLEAETSASLDGLVVTGLSLPKERSAPENLLELLSSSGDAHPTVQLMTASDSKPGRSGSRKHPRARGRSAGPHSEVGSGSRRDRHSERASRSRRSRRDGRSRHGGQSDGARSRGRNRRSRGNAEGKTRTGHSRRSHRGDPRDGRRQRRQRRQHTPLQRPPRLKPKRVHRSAALDALPQEQRALAREVMQGGVPGLRRTIERLNRKAESENHPRVVSEPLLVLGEKLAPSLKAAEWHDRADAALAGIDRLDLRDIRSVVVASERCAKTAQTRELAEKLKQGLSARIESDHSQWLNELAVAINDGRTVRALRLSSRPPKAGSPLPPDIHERLTALAAAGLSEGASQQRWSTVLQALAFSPVRMHVTPAGLPAKPDKKLLERVGKLAGHIPHIASLFGLAAAAGKRLSDPKRYSPSSAGSVGSDSGGVAAPSPSSV